MAQLAWYLKRLRVMSGREILHRLGQQLTMLQLLARYRVGMPLPVGSSADSSRLRFFEAREAQLPQLAFELPDLQEAAPGLLEGQMTVSGFNWQWREEPGIWHQAPDTGREWPKRFFASIAYREGNPYGDVRQLWEPARLQQLVDLAVIARTGNSDQRHRAVWMIDAQLASWVKDNPLMTGAHYISAMECALRLVAVCHALDMIRDQLADTSAADALASIVGTHAPLIAQRLSLHSSTGNHTTAEATGLVYAGLLFPEMEDARKWLSTGLTILEAESEHQVLPDGGGTEQALDYHLFNVQLLSLVQALLKHHESDVPPAIARAVNRGWDFLAAMGLAEGKLPAIGDSDGGYALSRYLLFPDHTGGPAPESRTFEHAGYTVARIASNPSLRLTFDHGPLGMPPSYGHGHADALAVILAAGDEDLLLDTGTYTYTGDQQWRRFFRGTRAHNTVTVDGQDQAVQEACFLWSRPFRTRLIASEIEDGQRGRLIAEHDGYGHLGVRHTRGIAWLHDQWLLIWDHLSGEGEHQLELNWHLGSEPFWRNEKAFELSFTGGNLEVLCEGGDIAVHGAEHAPIMGWRSPSYGILEPASTVSLTHDGTLPHAFTTLIRLPGSNRSGETIQDDLRWMRDQAR